MIKRRPVVVVLAAGRGLRFRGNGHKLEQSLGSGTLLSRTVAHALETQLRVVVVSSEKLAPMVTGLIGANDVIKVPELASSGRPNPLGMGFSIAAGVAATGDAEGWLIVPGDMPLLTPATILAVASAIEQYPVAFAQHRGVRGHPVGFSAELYSELVALEGDEGARRLLARYPAQAVDVEDRGVLVDVDTVEDLARLRGEQARERLSSGG